jgi:hypothetical protein
MLVVMVAVPLMGAASVAADESSATRWVADNIVTIVGWVSTLVIASFVVGRKLERLQGVDDGLAKALETLSTTIAALATRVHELERSRAHTETTLAVVRQVQTDRGVTLDELRGAVARLPNIEAKVDLLVEAARGGRP